MKPEPRRKPAPHPVRPEREALPPASHFATCPRGLEELLVAELTAAGAQVVRQLPAGVLFMADAAAEMRANLTSRIATRILRKVGYTRYRKEEHIYRAALDLPWPDWFDVKKTIAVKVGAQNAPLKSLNFITLKIKDAICDRFREETRERPSVDTEAPDVPVYAFFTPDAVTFYLDTSGEPLFKRGFKREASAASIKENLAAGLLLLSGWEPGTPLLDPMCGAGTILLEAADLALNRAPGRSRHFAFEHYRDFDAALWQRIKAEAKAQEKPLTRLPIFGADHDRWVLDKARNNLAAAGYLEAIELKVSDVLDLKPPTPVGTIVSNPPYGERIGDVEDLADWYPLLGDWLKQNFAGWDAWLISGDPLLPKLMGLKASRRIPLFNGQIETRFLQYKLIAGSMKARKSDDGQSANSEGS
ncbi:THUMP domain-containing protein [Thiobacillus sp. 65-1402]|uniref:THUMP domain-containing class I SAM-dependent RNA methyltransferase n=1 Tax=Thiobacillus sp. 65-1402 TaxID=1895861 RepID=UPI000ADB5299|nr:THUMP domain-containing protein [Thiobacillus sp. 65-1402]